LEDTVANVFQSLPPALAGRMIKHLQVSFAAVLLKDADDLLLREIVSNPGFAVLFEKLSV